ncbi:flagellar basal body-associated protein FliL [Kineobactrum salinum]|uniref:Flagellar protein FliL n=1 Tax=Kineobactrum salinum TaxID=2708301 RepID=A0A6C0TX26_9GAMM|nr:flagellar basal body-associated protein FliL [Kineobactrum salinum]QIB64326.1 flagellar basal body-associated protein FliL [Kineobactrum salinum]
MANTQNDSQKHKWLIIVLLLLTSALAGTNIYLLLPGDKVAEPGEEAVEAVEPETPLFVEIAPFTVNLQSDNYGNRLLYTGVSLQVGDEATRDLLLQHMPQLRSRLLTLISGQQAEALISPQGKSELVAMVLNMVQNDLIAGQPELAVRDVLFTEFIVQ